MSLKTSRRLENFAEVSKSNCTSKTKLYLKNLANLNPRKHVFVPICAVSVLELHALSRYPGNNRMTEHQQTTVCLRCACAPRHNYHFRHCARVYNFIRLATHSAWERDRACRLLARFEQSIDWLQRHCSLRGHSIICLHF